MSLDATRHPTNPPSSVPIGTPRTLAAATPPKMTAAASANGLVDCASWPVGMIPMIAIVETM